MIALLQDVTRLVIAKEDGEDRLAQIVALFGPHPAAILDQCAEHHAHAGNNYYPFLLPLYRSQRAVFFHFLESVTLKSTSQDRSVEDAIAFLRTHQATKDPTLKDVTQLTLAWIPDKWWPLVTGRPRRVARVGAVDRRYFELCLFSQLWTELKSGDLAIEGSAAFSDYRDQLVSQEEYDHRVAEYADQVGVSVQRKAFVASLREWLQKVATQTDASFPDNEDLRMEQDEIILRKLPRRSLPDGFRLVERALRERMPEINIVDVLAETDHWLYWTRHFRPLSGYEARLARPRERYVTTTFCYGCNLGPTQTARSMPGLDRKQVAQINQRHVSEALLDDAIVQVVNAYNQFTLPQLWGSGQHVSADGTKWDVYEQNLLAEYHVRYGG